MSAIPIILSDKSPVVKRHIARTEADNHSLDHLGERMMAREKRTDIILTLAANLNRIMKELKEKKDKRASNKKLATLAGISSNTVGRARRGSHENDGSITLYSLTKIAKVLEHDPLHLLTPDFNPADPPEIVTDAHEKDVLKTIRKRNNNRDVNGHDNDDPARRRPAH